ncbi:MAG: hypothetical protein ACREOA_00635 [Candidatus Dormibacteria bacterium]
MEPPHSDSEPREDPALSRVVPFDPVLAERLERPSDVRELYLPEASPYRPIVTGDLFQGLGVGDLTSEDPDHGLAMVVAHPSAMRKGATLSARTRAAPVTPVADLSKRSWRPGFYEVFQLPRLRSVAKGNRFEIADEAWGALLQEAAPIPTDELDVRRRIACLSSKGIHYLLHYLVHSDTRVAVRVDTIALTFAPKLEEIQLLEAWNEEFAKSQVAAGGALRTVLEREAERFEAVMGEPPVPGGKSVRDLIAGGSERGVARRYFWSAVRQRHAESGNTSRG